MVSGVDLTGGVWAWWTSLTGGVDVDVSRIVAETIVGSFGSYSSSLESTFLKVR